MVWHIVKFLKEDLVEAVPTCWYVKESSECFWPPTATRSDKILKMIQSLEVPQETWKPHSVKLLGTYEDYEVAQRKANRAKSTSDISSANNDVTKSYYKKRRRKPNPKYYSSSDDESGMEGLSDDTVYPVLNRSVFSSTEMPPMKSKKRSSSHSPSSRFSAEVYQNDIRPQMSQGKKQESNKNGFKQKRSRSYSPPSRSYSAEIFQGDSRQQKWDFQGIRRLESNENDDIRLQKTQAGKKQGSNEKDEPINLQTYLRGSKIPTDDVFKILVLNELSKLNLKVNTLVDSVNTLTNVQNLQQNTRNIQASHLSNDQLRFISDNLPLDTIETLTKFEQWLKEDANYNFTMSEFRRIGGHSIAQAIRKILYRSFKNEIATKYSWDGYKQKAALKNLRIARCVLDAIKVQYATISESEIINVIKVWLVKAKERLKREHLHEEEQLNIN